MKFTHEDQVSFAKVALKIFDVTEYLYEQLRLLRGDEGAFNDLELRKVIEADIKSHES